MNLWIIGSSVILVSTTMSIFSWLLARNKSLTKRTRLLEILQSVINDVSRLEIESEIIDVSLNVLRSSSLYSFASASFVKVDYVSRTVDIIPGQSHRAFMHLSDYFSFLAETQPEGQRFGIKGRGVRIKFGDDEIEDDSIVKLNSYTGSGMGMIIAPVIRRSRTFENGLSKDDDYVAAVILLEYSAPLFQAKPDKKLLNLFVDNVAQPYCRALSRTKMDEVDGLFKRLDTAKTSRDSLNEYVSNFLRLLRRKIKFHAGEISFLSVHSSDNWSNVKPVVIGDIDVVKLKKMRQAAFQKKRGFAHYVLTHRKLYYSGDVRSDPQACGVLTNENSQLCIPLMHRDQIVGVINLYSIERNFFDEFRAEFVNNLCKTFVSKFLIRRSNSQVNRLIRPFNIFKDYVSENLDSIRNAIGEIYYTENVGIWERANDVVKMKYNLKSASPNFMTSMRKMGLDSIEVDHIKNPTTILAKPVTQHDVSFPVVNELNCSFQISVPIKYGTQAQGMIFIFLKEKMIDIPDEEITLLNQLAVKCSMASQSAKLVDFFVKITDNLVTNTDVNDVLFKVTNYALNILNADSVVLFRYNKKSNEFSKGVHYSGSLTEQTLQYFSAIDANIPLLKCFIQRDAELFENELEYSEFLKEERINRSPFDFWQREKLKSSAVFRLGSADYPQGLMFFNFKEDNTLHDIYHSLEAFGQLATNAMTKVEIVNTIRTELKDLENRQQIIEKERHDLEIRATNFENQYKEVLSNVTRSSFYTILDGINHDLTNFLVRLTHTLDDIRESATLSHTLNASLDKHIHKAEETRNFIVSLIELFNFQNNREEYIDVDSQVRAVAKSFQFFYNDVKIRFHHEGKIAPLFCIRAELSMIIYNLISNSVKAIHDKEEKDGGIDVYISQQGNQFLVLRVKDNGLGIKRENLSKVFDYKYTTKVGGLGIGLFFIKQIVEQHYEGRVEVKSVYQEWTEFRIDFSLNRRNVYDRVSLPRR